MKDMIISKKAKEEEMLSKGIVDTTAPAKMAWILSFVDLAGRYT